MNHVEYTETTGRVVYATRDTLPIAHYLQPSTERTLCNQRAFLGEAPALVDSEGDVDPDTRVCRICAGLHDGNWSPRTAHASTDDLEYYVEVFEIIEYRDGCIWKTQSHGHAWRSSRQAPEGWVHAAPSDEFARENMTVRRATVPPHGEENV